MKISLIAKKFSTPARFEECWVNVVQKTLHMMMQKVL
jgi:hypothetical protein